MNDIPVGLLTCRIEYASAPQDSKPNSAKLYIATLGVLAPYRRQGLATRLLHHVLEASVAGVSIPVEKSTEAPKAVPKKGDAAKKPTPAPPAKVKFTSAYVHVQTSNESGREFWERNDFVVEQTIDQLSIISKHLMPTCSTSTSTAITQRLNRGRHGSCQRIYRRHDSWHLQ